MVPEGYLRYFFGVKVKTVKLIGGRVNFWGVVAMACQTMLSGMKFSITETQNSHENIFSRCPYGTTIMDTDVEIFITYYY